MTETIERPFILYESRSCQSVIRSILKPFAAHVGEDVDYLLDILYKKYVVEGYGHGDDAYSLQVFDYHRDVVIPHKIAVYNHGMKLAETAAFKHGGKYADEFRWRLIVHDFSKFSDDEAYPMSCTWEAGRRSSKITEATDKMLQQALTHHYNRNDHHPEYWVQNRRRASVAVPMEPIAVFEMIADWMGASESYNGGDFHAASFQEWLRGNFFDFNFHPETIAFARRMLALLKYDI